jgi:hypothetical protein
MEYETLLRRRIRKIGPTQPEIVVTVQSGLKTTFAANRIATSLRLPVPGVREG